MWRVSAGRDGRRLDAQKLEHEPGCMRELIVLMGTSNFWSQCGSIARLWLLSMGWVALAWLPSQAAAQECRMVFDLGSSGVRATSSRIDDARTMPWRDLDLLTPLMEGRSLEGLIPEVESTLRDLSAQLNEPPTCLRLGGGFSAWRLALKKDASHLARQLESLHASTGVAVLVIPSLIEGRYGHASALKALGPRLKTSHILDIGGGSMQVAGHDRSFGIELGQKSWHRLLCQRLDRAGTSCQLQPMQPGELQRARALADEQLQTLSAEIGTAQVTAISRPVTRGIQSALQALGLATPERISLRDLSQALEQLGGGWTLEQTLQLTQTPSPFASFLLSDMLLVEAVMRTLNLSTLALAETPINNLPALLQDDQAFEWAKRHPCYLKRLRDHGPAAYFMEPALCDRP